MLMGCLGTSMANAEVLGLYSAGNGSTAFSPTWDWGWSPSWSEAAQPTLGKSVSGELGGGLTAWQITDPVNNTTNPNYFFALYPGTPNYQLALERGWSFSTMAQFVDTLSGDPNQGLSAYFENHLFQFMVDKDSAGQLRAQLYLSPTEIASFSLASADQAAEYFEYEIRYTPATSQASFVFDGQTIHSWGGYPSAHESVFRFGSVTTDGAGQMNYREVTMSITPLPQESGDYNGDGTVDMADYAVWRNAFGSRGNSTADANGNGLVDIGDYRIWKANFGRVLDGDASANSSIAVPEPTTVSQLTLLVMVFGGLRRSVQFIP